METVKINKKTVKSWDLIEGALLNQLPAYKGMFYGDKPHIEQYADDVKLAEHFRDETTSFFTLLRRMDIIEEETWSNLWDLAYWEYNVFVETAYKFIEN